MKLDPGRIPAAQRHPDPAPLRLVPLAVDRVAAGGGLTLAAALGGTPTYAQTG